MDHQSSFHLKSPACRASIGSTLRPTPTEVWFFRFKNCFCFITADPSRVHVRRISITVEILKDFPYKENDETMLRTVQHIYSGTKWGHGVRDEALSLVKSHSESQQKSFLFASAESVGNNGAGTLQTFVGLWGSNVWSTEMICRLMIYRIN